MESSYSEQFKKIVIPEMKKMFGYHNEMAVPKIEKVVLNVGIGRMLNKASNKEAILQKVSEQLALISGQKPSIRPARKSIASFKIRKGMPVGLKVTLRGKRMEDFIYKFINIVLPRIRDFWGIPLSNIDEQGNLNYGIKEHLVFPEISREQDIVPFGVEVTFVTTTKDREKAIALYRLLGFPLKNKEEK